MRLKCSECDNVFFKYNIRSNEVVTCPKCGSHFICKAPRCKLNLEDR